MAHVYVVANLGKTAVIFSNMSKVWRYVETAAAGSEIYHGTTAMDAFRLRRVKNYAAFTTSLKLNGFTAAPFFWETSAGVVAITITRQRVE